jgi:hypothetical protein
VLQAMLGPNANELQHVASARQRLADKFGPLMQAADANKLHLKKMPTMQTLTPLREVRRRMVRGSSCQ